MSADRDNDKKRARVEDESEVEVVRVRDSWKLPGSKSGKGKERELRRRPSIKNRNSSESPKKSTRRAEAADEDEGASTSTSRTLASAASSLHPGTPQSPPHDAVPNPENNEKDLEIERLRKELATKNEVIEKQEKTLTAVHNSLLCQICLEILWKPYTIIPCGHVCCLGCLQQWFRQPPPPEDGGRIPPKACPCCRTIVSHRPTILYVLKTAVTLLAPLNDPSQAPPVENAAEDVDPWRGIVFKGDDRQAQLGILDEEDGGIRRCGECLAEILDGECTGCGRLYAIDGVYAFPEEEAFSDEEDGLDDQLSEGSYEGSFIDDENGPPMPVPRWFDDMQHIEDLIFRRGRPAVVGGRVVYHPPPHHSDEEDEEDQSEYHTGESDEGEDIHRQAPRPRRHHYFIPPPIYDDPRPDSSVEEEEEEVDAAELTEAESDDIPANGRRDPGARRRRYATPPHIIEVDEEEEEEEANVPVAGPSRPRGRRVVSPVEVSSGEEEAPIRRRSLRGNRSVIVISSDEDENMARDESPLPIASRTRRRVRDDSVEHADESDDGSHDDDGSEGSQSHDIENENRDDLSSIHSRRSDTHSQSLSAEDHDVQFLDRESESSVEYGRSGSAYHHSDEDLPSHYGSPYDDDQEDKEGAGQSDGGDAAFYSGEDDGSDGEVDSQDGGSNW